MNTGFALVAVSLALSMTVPGITLIARRNSRRVAVKLTARAGRPSDFVLGSARLDMVPLHMDISVRAVLRLVGAAVVWLVLPLGALAHHSTMGEYDRSQTIEFDAVLERAILINPHTFFHFSQVLPDGTEKKWDIQWGSPSQLQRAAAGQYGTVYWEVGKVHHIKASPHRTESGNAY